MVKNPTSAVEDVGLIPGSGNSGEENAVTHSSIQPRKPGWADRGTWQATRP